MTVVSAQRLTVLDAGSGIATAVMAKLMRELGASVVRIEPSPEPLDRRYGFVAAWEPWTSQASLADFEHVVAEADIVLLGGESLPDQTWSVDAEELVRCHPTLIAVEVTGWAGDPSFPAVEVLVQARSGIAFEQHLDRPAFYGQQPGAFGAALLGLGGAWAALLQRRTTHAGQVVRTSMLQGLGLVFPSIWMEAERPGPKFDLVQPRGVQQMVFQCADGEWIQIVLGTKGSLARLYDVLGIDEYVDPNHAGAPNPQGGLRNYYAPYDTIAPAVAKFDRAKLIVRLREAQVGAELTNNPGDCWDDPQVAQSGIIVASADGGRRVGTPVTVRSVESGADGYVPVAHPEVGEPPLTGIRVVDFGNFVAGPMAARMLCDLGAEVIWIEPVDHPRPVTTFRNVLASNRGKRGIRVDLKDTAGTALIHELAARSDVFTHNFRVGVAERLGIDPVSLRKVNPHMVTLQTSGYGQTGPRATATGFDPIFQSFTGLARRASGPDAPPELCRSNIVDYMSAAMGTLGVLIALNERAETGRAVEVEVDLLRTGIFLLSDVLEGSDGVRRAGVTIDPTQTGFVPWERIWRTRDGWIAVSARTDEAAAAFASTLGVTHAGPRAAWDRQTVLALTDAIAAMETASVLADLEKLGVWACAVTEDGWSAVRDDRAARESGLVAVAEDPRYGRVTGWFGSLVTMTGGGPRIRKVSAPTPGQHTVEVLAELGRDPSEIARLIEAGVVAGDDTGW